jgi:hypothetical protein
MIYDVQSKKTCLFKKCGGQKNEREEFPIYFQQEMIPVGKGPDQILSGYADSPD